MLEETGTGVRAPPDRHLEQRVEGSGVRVAEPERTHTGDHRSGLPDGRPIALWESGAILLYLTDKTGQFISTEPYQRYETLAWVFFQMSTITDVRSARLLPAIWRQGL